MIIAAGMPRLKNCWACDISSISRGGSRMSKGVGGGEGAQRALKVLAF